MELPYFIMKPGKRGLLKYLLLTLVPPAVVGLLMDMDAAAMVFVPLIFVLLFPRAHKIVVFGEALWEKSTYGVERLSSKIPAGRISHYRRNSLDEIILEDADGRKLLCVESHLSDRDRFLDWLAAHHIESK